MVDARLPDGSRVNAVVPPIALDGSLLTIRKFAADPFTDKRPHLVRHDDRRTSATSSTPASSGRRNIIISGGTGSGKTTTLNVISSFLPHDERIVTIEDAAELQLQQDHVLRLEARPANIEGRGAISIRELVQNCLRMRPDRIIVGEIRDGAALDMLQAMNTGHDGSITTVHANTPRDSLARLETMVLMAGVDLPVRAIREQVAGAVDLIVQQSRLKDGSRRIVAITEVVGMESDVITLQDIFTFDYGAGRDENGRFLRQPRADRYPPEVHRTTWPTSVSSCPSHSSRGRRCERYARRLVTGSLRSRGRTGGPAGWRRARGRRVGRAEQTSRRPRPDRARRLTGVITLRSKVDVQVDPASLKVKVDGQEVPATVKQAAKLDRRAMLVIDTSGSMGAQGMATVRKAVRHLPQDRAGRRPGRRRVLRQHRRRRPRADARPRRRAARHQRPRLARRHEPVCRRCRAPLPVLGGTGDRSIVLLSDGADTVADNKALALQERRRQAQGRRHPRRRRAVQDERPRRHAALQAFAGANGGSVVAADDTAGVSAAFAASAQALNRQVQFSAAIPKALAGPHTVRRRRQWPAAPASASARQVTFGAPAVSAVAAPSDAGACRPVALPRPRASARSAIADRTPYIAAGLLALALFVLLSTSLTPTLQTKRERRVAVDRHLRRRRRDHPLAPGDQGSSRAPSRRSCSTWATGS